MQFVALEASAVGALSVSVMTHVRNDFYGQWQLSGAVRYMVCFLKMSARIAVPGNCSEHATQFVADAAAADIAWHPGARLTPGLSFIYG